MLNLHVQLLLTELNVNGIQLLIIVEIKIVKIMQDHLTQHVKLLTQLAQQVLEDFVLKLNLVLTQQSELHVLKVQMAHVYGSQIPLELVHAIHILHVRV
jgi:UTP-glucose-1-phosphate uridylyltransferase